VSAHSFELELDGDSHAFCDCCGNRTIRIWGWLHKPDATVAAYFVSWTEQKPDHGASVDLIFGDWGDGADSTRRTHAYVRYDRLAEHGSFMVQDASEEMITLAAQKLAREDVIGTPIASFIFSMLDAIWLGDDRLYELRNP
jgi:hypothetical protein